MYRIGIDVGGTFTDFTLFAPPPAFRLPADESIVCRYEEVTAGQCARPPRSVARGPIGSIPQALPAAVAGQQ